MRKRHWKPALERAGLPAELRVYDLRHSFVTAAIRAGERPEVVAELVGHADVSLTLDVYRHVHREEREAAARRAGGLLLTE